MKNWCSFLVLIGVGLLLAQNSYAQDRRQQNFERVESEKIVYITKQLSLTPMEAQQFFPIYNSYRKEVTDVLHRSRGPERNRRGSRIDELAVEGELLAIKKKYRAQYAKIIGPARASRFFEVEREFREMLLKELRKRGGGPDRSQRHD